MVNSAIYRFRFPSGPLHERMLNSLFSKAKRTQAERLQQTGKLIQSKLRQYIDVGQALSDARDSGGDSGISGVDMTLESGAVREMHWHPNANEWQYYISGKGRMTVFSSHGHAETAEYDATDIGYVPQGYGHYIENIGDEDLKVLVVLDNGIYEDISLSEWLAKTPAYVLADNFNNNEADWNSRPVRRVRNRRIHIS